MTTQTQADALSLDRLRALLSYDENTGQFVWIRDCGNATRTGNMTSQSLDSDGYRRVMINGRSYKAHRLVWFYVHGVWPAEQIDHINGARTDNRISNLRPASDSQNKQNARIRSDNKTGYKGVTYFEQIGKWVAKIGYGGKLHYLGCHPTPEAASAAYQKAAKEMHGEFARLK